MNNLEIIELIDAVTSIQEDINNTLGFDSGLNLMVCTNGFVFKIDFGEIWLWSSEDDCRIFDENTNEYEPFEPYLRQILNEKLIELKKIKV